MALSDPLPPLFEAARGQYKDARARALRRLRLGTGLAWFFGFLGVAILTLKAYDLLHLLVGNTGDALLNFEFHNYSTQIASVFVILGFGVGRTVQYRGYANQFLRYSLALSEIEILIGLYQVHKATVLPDQLESELSVEFAEKLAVIVRDERRAFASDTRQDLELLLAQLKQHADATKNQAGQ